MKRLFAAACLAGGLFAQADTASADCGEVSIAQMNWGSASLAAALDKIVLESGYGCKVTLVPGDMLSTFASMDEKGEPDIAPEFWINAVRTALDKAVDENRLLRAAPILSEGGIEGWWIPKFVADAHSGIKTVQDALKEPGLFPAPGDPGKGAIHACPKGWNCEISTANLFRALEADKAGFELVPSADAAALDASLINAFETRTGWLGYYWAPSSILGKYEMVKLSFGTGHDKSEWNNCTSIPDCPAPKVNSYPTSDAYTLVTQKFASRAGPVMDYLKARKWDNQTIGGLLAWMTDNGATNADAARHFLRDAPDIWTGWLPPDVAARVKAAL